MKNTLAYWVGTWVGENFILLIFATAAAIVAGLITFQSLKSKPRTFWNVIITVWFLALALAGFVIASGCAYNITSNAGESIMLGLFFAAVTALTPFIVIKGLKTKAAKWIYSLIIIILVGFRIPLIEALYRGF